MDEIRQKLEAFYDRLEGKSLYKQIISRCPLLILAVAFIAGVVIQNTFVLAVSIWFIVLTLAVIVRLALYKLDAAARLHITVVTVCVCFVSLGAVRLASYQQPGHNDIRNFVKTEPTFAHIRAVIITEPVINDNSRWHFSRFSPALATTGFYAQIKEMKTQSGWIKASGKIKIYISKPAIDLRSGDFFQLYCRLSRFRPSHNPGQFDTKDYMNRKNIFLSASVKSRGAIELMQTENTASGVFMKSCRMLRRKASEALLSDIASPEDSRGLLAALLLGKRGDIEPDVYEAFRQTGLLHFISLSGLHIGILIGLIWWLCRKGQLLKPARAVVCLIALAVFAMVVPPRAPTLRAAIICSFFCISFIIRRKANPFNALSLAAIVLLLIKPTDIFNVGFQLSFATVTTILLFQRPLENILHQTLIYRHKSTNKQQ